MQWQKSVSARITARNLTARRPQVSTPPPLALPFRARLHLARVHAIDLPTTRHPTFQVRMTLAEISMLDHHRQLVPKSPQTTHSHTPEPPPRATLSSYPPIKHQFIPRLKIKWSVRPDKSSSRWQPRFKMMMMTAVTGSCEELAPRPVFPHRSGHPIWYISPAPDNFSKLS